MFYTVAAVITFGESLLTLLFFLDSCVDCGSVSQNLSDDFAVSVEAWHLLNTYNDYKNGTL